MPLRHLKVMLVDDDPDVRELATISLEDLGGCAIVACGSGEEAVRRVRDVRPDIILLDAMMPGMDGPTTLCKLRADPAAAGIPVVFLTAAWQDVESFTALGAADVIAKPFDPEQLCASVLDIWKRTKG